MSNSYATVSITIADNERLEIFGIEDNSKVKENDLLVIDTSRGMHFIHMNKKHTEALYKKLEKHLYSDKTYSELESHNHKLENQIEELKDQLRENYA